MSDCKRTRSSLRILLAGVGGQGVVTAAGWLALAADRVGLAVVVGQAHTMSQRGGCVTAAVMIEAGQVASIGRAEADVLVALEPMEAARSADRLRPAGLALVDTHGIPPHTLAQAGLDYPAVDLLLAGVEQRTDHCLRIPAHRIASDGGDARRANLVLLGVLQGLDVLPWEADDLRQAILTSVPMTWREGVIQALQRGIDLGRDRPARRLPVPGLEPARGDES